MLADRLLYNGHDEKQTHPSQDSLGTNQKPTPQLESTTNWVRLERLPQAIWVGSIVIIYIMYVKINTSINSLLDTNINRLKLVEKV